MTKENEIEPVFRRASELYDAPTKSETLRAFLDREHAKCIESTPQERPDRDERRDLDQ